MKASAYVGILLAACAVIGLAAPLTAAAEEVRITTTQVIPPGGTSCSQLQVLNIQPYTEDNALHSFDVTVNDSSYVVLLTSVGDTEYSFQYVSRWKNADGSVRQHVDINTKPIGTSLPISLTLLSAKTGQPVCLSIITFSITGSGTPVPGPTQSAPQSNPTPVVPTVPATTTGPAATTSVATTSVVRGSVTTLTDICAQNGSLQLWFLLITLYLIGAAAIALREPTVPERSLSVTTLMILVPAIILLAFWAFATACRGAQWVPVVVFIIAIASLLAALWEREPATKMVELAPVKKKELLSGPSNTV